MYARATYSHLYRLATALLLGVAGLIHLSAARADVPFVASWNAYTDCRNPALVPTIVNSSGYSSCVAAREAGIAVFDANCNSGSTQICPQAICPSGSAVSGVNFFEPGGVCNSYVGMDVTCPAGAPPQYNATTGEWTCPSSAFARQLALGYPSSRCPTGQCQGNPVNPAVGNKFEREVDYVGPGPFPLQFVRFYNSLGEPGDLGATADISARLGRNWTHNYNRRLRFGGTTITRVSAQRPDGKSLPFELSGSSFVSNPNINEVLTKTVSGWTLLNLEDELETYDSNGRLASITNRSGLTQTLSYNASGFISTVTDPFGRTLSFTYGALDRIAVITLPGGSTLGYTYTAPHISGISVLNSLLSVVYPDGKVRGYSYTSVNPPGKFPYLLTGITDENGAAYATFTYTTAGLVTSTEHAGGANKLTVTNSTATPNRTVSVTRYVSATQSATRNYDFSSKFGMAVSTAISGPDCPDCGPKWTTPDANGNPKIEIDWNGNWTCFGYGTDGRNLERRRIEGFVIDCSSQILSDPPSLTAPQRLTSTDWHPSLRVPTRIAEPLRITTYVYNGDGGVTCGATGALCSKTVQATTDATGSQGFAATTTGTPRAWSYTYNANGQVLTVNGPRTDVSDVTTYTYFANDDADLGKRANVATVSNALSQVTSVTAYNAHGQPLTIVDPNGLTTTLAYDPRQRLTSRTVGTETTIYAYDSAGQLTTVTLPDGSFLSYSYDPAHRLTSIQDNLGNRIAYTLDYAGNRTQEQVFDPSNALAQTRSRVYSNINRLFQELGATGQTTEYGYDFQGNVISVKDPLTVTDPLNHTTTNQYDPLNRLKQVTDPATGVTLYGYNGLGALTQVTDPRSLVTAYTVDGLGNVTQQTSPDTGTTTRSYDAAGNVLTQTDARGKTGTYSYDALNRLTGISYGTNNPSNVSYSYDAGTNGLGRRTGMSLAAAPAGGATWSYDQKGRVIRMQSTSSGHVHVTNYGYDPQGRLATVTYPSGKIVAYGYDAAGRVASVSVDGYALASNIAYHPFGAPKSWIWGDGSTMTRSFDQDGRMSAHSLAGATRTIAYDVAGRITQIDGDTYTYAYDVLDRLTSYVAPATNQSYVYDANGNRTQLTLGATSHDYTVAGSSNQLLATAGPTPARTFSFDASGNVTGDGTRSFAYQDDGRMAAVTAGASTLYNNYYNGLGQRYWKQSLVSATTSALFTYDPAGRLLGEYNFSGEAVREYVYLGDIPVGVLVTNALVMDNVGTGTSVVGTWATVNKSSADPSAYGNDYRTHAAGTGAASFTWTPAMGSNNTLRVYARWVAGADRATNATYEVISAAGTTSVTVNQQQQGGQWVALGTYDFVPGQGHGARLTDNANGLVVADAVKFLPANANTVFAIHTDHLNTPRAVRSSNGNTMWRWDSDPFGSSAPNEDPSGLAITFSLPLRFPGQYFDAETGTHYNYHRDYSPQEGRYIQSDPIGLAGGLNTYAYVGGNPLSFIDLDGLQITRGNRERGERPGRERPEGGASSPSQSASSTSSAADKQFCYTLCMQRENDRNLRNTVLSCGVITAAAVAGAVLSGGTASPLSALAICAGCPIGIGAGLTLNSDSKCRRDCGLDPGIADQLTQPRKRGGSDPLSLQQ